MFEPDAYDEEDAEEAPDAEAAETFALTRPLARLKSGDPARSLAEVAASLHAFADAASLLNLPPGTRILDAGCGAGWVSHWLARLGYRTLGVDASDEAVDLARTRIAEDPSLESELEEIDAMFLAHDLGAEPLPEEAGRFAAALFMHGFKGFADAARALEHAAGVLEEDGVVLILGRPARTRPELEADLDAAGLTHRRFLGAAPGWYAGILGGAEGCVAALTSQALARIAPPPPPPPPPRAKPAEAAPTPPPAPPRPGPVEPSSRPNLLARLLRAFRG